MKLYRARAVGWDEPYDSREIWYDEYSVVEQTEYYYWISYFPHNPKKWKKVSKNGRRRFAYPTKKEALESFIQRQKHRIWWGKHHLKEGKIFLAMAEAELKTQGGKTDE
jgi:hypothetical protein